MTTYRIVTVGTERRSPTNHEVIVAVQTYEAPPAATRRWTVQGVLQAMNRADRFFTQVADGRPARVQRYRCVSCHEDHIRTHVNDALVDDMGSLRRDGGDVARRERG